jgi:hypothetical protein
MVKKGRKRGKEKKNTGHTEAPMMHSRTEP